MKKILSIIICLLITQWSGAKPGKKKDHYNDSDNPRALYYGIQGAHYIKSIPVVLIDKYGVSEKSTTGTTVGTYLERFFSPYLSLKSGLYYSVYNQTYVSLSGNENHAELSVLSMPVLLGIHTSHLKKVSLGLALGGSAGYVTGTRFEATHEDFISGPGQKLGLPEIIPAALYEAGFEISLDPEKMYHLGLGIRGSYHDVNATGVYLGLNLKL